MASSRLTRRTFLGTVGVGAAALAMPHRVRAAETQPAGKRMNILWIMAEDMGPELGCYGYPLVHTPNIDRLAAEGVSYATAFCTAPVCSPSRSGMITGMYQTTIGAHQHRSHRDGGYTLPPPVRMITEYLREAGYYTANANVNLAGKFTKGKTDFNFATPGVQPFDGVDWKDRGARQPFFQQITLPVTHRAWSGARAWADEKGLRIDPAKVTLPPYYPDHPVTRDDWAHYLESINAMDAQVGALVQRLKEEGVYDDTAIFFIGDNGRCHVRGKQWLYEGGIRVPLIARWPGVTRPGTVSEDLAMTIDISATILAVAGVAVPAHMEGRVLLGPSAAPPREYIVAARDRCDETVDRIRCVRDKEFKYIRNFMPDRPYTQSNAYKSRSYPVLPLMEQLHAEGKLTPVQELWFAPRRPAEELYDLRDDPHEVRNLAALPEHRERLDRMRVLLDAWIKATGDKGAIPEDPSAIPSAPEPKAPKAPKTASKKGEP
jgi:arylsulfatase A-like enzyme